MYNKKKLIDSLNGVLNLIPNDISKEGVEKKEEIKKELKKIENKTKKSITQQQEENEIVKG